MGADADEVFVDPDSEWNSEVVSPAGWTPYAGWRLRGRAVATMLRGPLIVERGRLVDNGCAGRFVRGAGAAWAPAQ